MFGPMISLRRATRTTAAAVLVFVALLLVSAIAFAGGVQFRDTAEVLTPADRQAISQQVAHLPFDARVLTSTSHPGADQFDSYVRSQLGSANSVIVGIDPVHRRTAVYCGAATRVDGARCKGASEAGKQHFRESRWAPGIEAVLGSVSEAMGANASSATTAQPAARRSGLGSVFGMLVLGAVGLIAIVAILSAVFRKKSPAMTGATQGPPFGGMYPNQPPPGQPYPYQGGYPPPAAGMGGGIGSHIAAAGLGGLAGYGLGRMLSGGEHGHGPDQQAGVIPDDPDRNAAGGTSDWDDGGGSDDASGGGSDWGDGGDMGGDGGGSDW